MRTHLYNPDEVAHHATFNDVTFEIPSGESIDVGKSTPVRGEKDDTAGDRVRILNHAKTLGTHDPEAVAEHLANYLKRFGVVRLEGPARGGDAARLEDQALVDAAHEQAVKNRHEMCKQALVDHAKRGKEFLDIGLEWPDTEPVAKARKWLEAHKR